MEPACITFEQAKFLKEKGFNEKTSTYFLGKENIQLANISWGAITRKYLVNSDFGEFKVDSVSRPEQHQVVDWLEVKHQKYVYAFRYNGMWQYKIDSENSTEFFSTGKGYNSKKEAYSAAFDYIQSNKLI